MAEQAEERAEIIKVLKKAKLRSFSGVDKAGDGDDAQNWEEFSNQFYAQLGRNGLDADFDAHFNTPDEHLPIGQDIDTALFWLIKSSLTGEALQETVGIEKGNAYHLWKALKDKYQPERRHQVMGLISQLINPGNPPAEPDQVPAFLTKQNEARLRLEEILRTSKKQLQPYDILLLGIQKNLPSELVGVSDALQNKDKEPTWQDLKAALYDKVDSLAQDKSSGSKEATVLYTQNTRGGTNYNTKKAFPECCYCGKTNHYAASCFHRPGAPAKGSGRGAGGGKGGGPSPKGKGKGGAATKDAECHRCGKRGHFARACNAPSPKK
jgi:hypothetical protein